MQITYDPEADALYIRLRPAGVDPAKSVDLEEGVTADLDEDGHIVGIELLDARNRCGGDPLNSVQLDRLEAAQV